MTLNRPGYCISHFGGYHPRGGARRAHPWGGARRAHPWGRARRADSVLWMNYYVSLALIGLSVYNKLIINSLIIE